VRRREAQIPRIMMMMMWEWKEITQKEARKEEMINNFAPHKENRYLERTSTNI
jgi:hypothetical protein